MARRPSLLEADQKPQPTEITVLPEPTQLPLATPTRVDTNPARAAVRQGKRNVAFWVSAATHEEFRIAILRERSSVQKAGEEMLQDWFRKRGMRIAGQGREGE
jgi:hypothetical protein